MKKLLAIFLFLSIACSEAFSDISELGLYDQQGNPLSTNSSSYTRNPLDIEIMFSGSIIDPRLVTCSAGTNLNTSALALSTTQTNGTQKTQVVDGSGNVQPSGDVLTRKIFIQPTDGSNNQGYTASNEAKVLVTPLTNSSVVKAQLQDNSGAAITLGQKVMTSSVPVVLASDHSTITVQGASGAPGTPSGGIITIQGVTAGSPVIVVGNVADGAAASGNPVRVAGKDGSGNVQDIFTDTAGNQAVLLKDASANGITSTTESGTAANKQPLDVNPISVGTGRYYSAFNLQQSAATAANASVFAARNAAASTKTAILENIYCRMGFNAANPLTRTQQTYLFQRFSAATPTGGTALTASLGDSSDSASQVTDIRFLDTGLTTTGVTFVANNLGIMACDATQGITCQEPITTPPSAWRFAPGEGLVIRLGVAAVAGQTLSCNLAWREQ